jgi:tRNA uridine 5-carbamoylmethylation protein Kti12
MTRQPTLVIFRGLPGSGKTYLAREILNRAVAVGRRGTIMRINRDDFRTMALDGAYRKPEGPVEDAVTVATHAAIRALLIAGIDVICDDTNLHDEHVHTLAALARTAGAHCEIRDLTRTVPLNVCLRRDALRPVPVGEQVIRAMHERHIASVS